MLNYLQTEEQRRLMHLHISPGIGDMDSRLPRPQAPHSGQASPKHTVDRPEAGLPCSIRRLALRTSGWGVWSLQQIDSLSLAVPVGGRRLLDSQRAR